MRLPPWTLVCAVALGLCGCSLSTPAAGDTSCIEGAGRDALAQMEASGQSAQRFTAKVVPVRGSTDSLAVAVAYSSDGSTYAVSTFACSGGSPARGWGVASTGGEPDSLTAAAISACEGADPRSHLVISSVGLFVSYPGGAACSVWLGDEVEASAADAVPPLPEIVAASDRGMLVRACAAAAPVAGPVTATLSEGRSFAGVAAGATVTDVHLDDREAGTHCRLRLDASGVPLLEIRP